MRSGTGKSRNPGGLTLPHRAAGWVEAACPEVEWLNSYAVLGPCDFLDIFWVPDIDTATKVATVVRTFGHAETEIWAATEWQRFKELVRYLPPATRAEGEKASSAA